MKIFEIEEFTFGIAGKTDKIIFKSIRDLDSANEEINNAKGLYVKTKDGLVTALSHRLLYQRIYDGSMLLCAREESEKSEVKKQ